MTIQSKRRIRRQVRQGWWVKVDGWRQSSSTCLMDVKENLSTCCERSKGQMKIERNNVSIATVRSFFLLSLTQICQCN